MGRTTQRHSGHRAFALALALLLCASCLPAFGGQGQAHADTLIYGDDHTRIFVDGRVETDTECFLRILDNTLESVLADEEESSGKLETVDIQVLAGGSGETTLVGDLKGGWGTVTLRWYRATAGADALASDGMAADGAATWELLSSVEIAAADAVEPNEALEGHAAQRLDVTGLAPGIHAYKLVATDEVGNARTIWWVVNVVEQVVPTPAPTPTPEPAPTPAPPQPAPVQPMPQPVYMPKLGDVLIVAPLVTGVLALLIIFVLGKRRKDEDETPEG